MSGRLFVISAPSGAGKTTLIKELRQNINNLGYSVSHTTRRPRPGEVHGVNYYFVTRQQFEAMISKGEFVEWAEVYGSYYGTSAAELDRQLSTGKDILLDLDPQGAKNIKRIRPECILIFVLPPSIEELKRRLEDRGTDDLETIEKRLAKAKSEIKECKFYDFIVINDKLQDGLKELQSIIIADRCSRDRRLDFILKTFNFST